MVLNQDKQHIIFYDSMESLVKMCLEYNSSPKVKVVSPSMMIPSPAFKEVLSKFERGDIDVLVMHRVFNAGWRIKLTPAEVDIHFTWDEAHSERIVAQGGLSTGGGTK